MRITEGPKHPNLELNFNREVYMLEVMHQTWEDKSKHVVLTTHCYSYQDNSGGTTLDYDEGLNMANILIKSKRFIYLAVDPKLYPKGWNKTAYLINWQHVISIRDITPAKYVFDWMNSRSVSKLKPDMNNLEIEFGLIDVQARIQLCCSYTAEHLFKRIRDIRKAYKEKK